MRQQFNFQFRPRLAGRYWEKVKVHTRTMRCRQEAVSLAKRAATFYKTEVRLTEGKPTCTTSGIYFNYQDQ